MIYHNIYLLNFLFKAGIFPDCGFYQFSCLYVIKTYIQNVSSYNVGNFVPEYSWIFYLEKGLNNITVNDSIFLQMGTLFTWYSIDGGIIELYPTESYYPDYLIDMKSFNITRLPNTNISRCFYFSITIEPLRKTYFLSFLQYYKVPFNIVTITGFINNQSYPIQNIKVTDCE